MFHDFKYLIRDFKRLDFLFYKILLDKKATDITYCISILQFIKPHSEYFIKYKYFINKRFYFIFFIFFKFFLDNFFRIIKWAIRKSEDFCLSLFFYKTNNLDVKSNDIIFITTLVNANTLKSRKNVNKDFTFGNIIADLRINYNVKVFYINNTTSNSRKIFQELRHNNNIFILKKILSFSDEVSILSFQLAELKNLILNFFIKKINLYNSFLIFNNLFSYESRNNIRLKIQLKKLLNIYSPKIIVTSFEGHCWEKTVFNICKSIDGVNIKTIGYLHGGVIKNQFSINRKYKKNYNPDYILTSGKINLDFFSNFFFKKKDKLFEIGSNRSSFFSKNKILKNFLNNRKKFFNCLIFPEGTYEETKILFDFAYSLAKAIPKINFILRAHPQINIRRFIKRFFILNRYESLSNFIISENSFHNDLKRSQMLLYRGSTGVVTAVLNGLIPIYYRKPNEDINIDPIFRLKDFRKVISNQKDFIKIINTNFFPSIKQTVSAIRFCKNYFTNQERNKTNLIFNTILNKKS
jgi:hypothetical protein